MTDFLPGFIALLAMVCLLGFFNEKVTKLTYEISLMLFSTVLGIIIMVVAKVFFGQSLGSIFKYGGEDEFNIELFLINGVLCFMLFAGSCHLKLMDFFRHARQVNVLSFITTFLGAVFYGGCSTVRLLCLG